MLLSKLEKLNKLPQSQKIPLICLWITGWLVLISGVSFFSYLFERDPANARVVVIAACGDILVVALWALMITVYNMAEQMFMAGKMGE